MNRVVVISGGLDSSTLLFHQVKAGEGVDQVIPLFFNYGQRCFQRELEAASRIVDGLGLDRVKMVNIPQLSFMFGKNVITDLSMKMPQQNRHMELYEQLEDHVVPNRNVIMVEIGVAYAISLGEPALVTYGAQASDDPDFDLFPDVQQECVELLDKVADYTSKGMVRVYAPFVHMVKSQVIRLAVKLGVPLKDTWSCYENGIGPDKLCCGVCCSCIDRVIAFERAGLTHLDVKYAQEA